MPGFPFGLTVICNTYNQDRIHTILSLISKPDHTNGAQKTRIHFIRSFISYVPSIYCLHKLMLQLYAIERTDRVTIVHPREHRVTLIWLHGLDQPRQLHLPAILEVLEGHLEHVKIVVPSAPQRLVTIMKKEASSWFDVKFRSNQSFKVPFDEAFSSVEVQHSYEEILKPIIEAERKILDGLTARGRLVVAGFSQGCGMSLHCLYSNPKGVDAALGIAGYFFSITKFSQLTNETYVIHGLADTLRPWSICKETYEGKIIEERIRLVQGMGHEITDNTKKCMKEILCALLLIG